MIPEPYEGDFLVIDASLDHSIFPAGISNGLDVLAQDIYSQHNFSDGYAEFSQFDIDEFKDHP